MYGVSVQVNTGRDVGAVIYKEGDVTFPPRQQMYTCRVCGTEKWGDLGTFPRKGLMDEVLCRTCSAWEFGVWLERRELWKVSDAD